ncbi:MAG: hypothetical protein COV29_02110 [Candidatus Yanofskybacteria bacterium CG10_big_fil_rev_8_21_14_0_10_36_16]|uniref:Uncharacterized protein n=1 Tax=Candidatus Yanofskybacteria bacterium CG10_big_fil_rev_8_21_14_0_10_36_16 TaxID=1975096 RepID=A0A2J0Q7J1_9BACT|nr:MAG: hypothetical protein COV29_02110 [Candidatus Yanofskybacteria bacterium CG10_big_fil_rev_8_21_14_0_10_36_16]
MYLKKSGVNWTKKNIFKVSHPYYILEKKQKSPTVEPNCIVFFGADFKNIRNLNVKEFVKKTNQCLEYIKKKYKGHKLYYKPHPDETDEFKQLKLDGFTFFRNGESSEDFLWKNKKNIDSTFSVCSTSSISSYNFGINSHVFFRGFLNCFDEQTYGFMQLWFGDMPDNFFIKNIGSDCVNNQKEIKENKILENKLRGVFNKNKGSVWLSVAETRYVPAVVALAILMKEIDYTKKINLVISNHHRWSEKHKTNIRDYFDTIIILPRFFYSLKPKTILNSILLSNKIKKLPVKSSDILIGFSYFEFVENCMMSYFKNNIKINFMTYANLKFHFDTASLDFVDLASFKINKANRFYKNILEPLLGLNKTLFFNDIKSGINIRRLVSPVNDVYDEIYLFR